MSSPPVNNPLSAEALTRVAPRIEVLNDDMAEVLRRKTPAERLAIGFGLWRSARKILRGQLASLHPEWEASHIDREVARRLSHGAV
jgi:Rv0078B-related antitoxin